MLKPLRAVPLLFILCLAAGCGGQVAVLDAQVDRDTETLRVSVNFCNGTGHRVSVDEDADEVRVSVRVGGGPHEGVRNSCADVLDVPLTRPLGDRTVLDTSTDRPVEVLRHRP